ncbi:MAG: hypothetical protein WCJ86_02300 [Candidatus Saccharibacteria bacterium]
MSNAEMFETQVQKQLNPETREVSDEVIERYNRLVDSGCPDLALNSLDVAVWRLEPTFGVMNYEKRD